MFLQLQYVGACQLKPDIHGRKQSLVYPTIKPIKPMLNTMPAFINISDKIANSQQVKPIQKMKMLLVEDSVLLRDTLIEVINHLDNVLVTGTAATQAQAIIQLNESQFDIVLLDIELAQGNGFEVIKYMKQKQSQSENATVKFPVLMMLTNHAHPHYRSLAKTLGVPYFFDKSMDFDLAIDAIELEADRFSNAQH